VAASLACRAANLAWMATGLPQWRRFRQALRAPRHAQLRNLIAILRRNQETEAGRHLNFAAVLEPACGSSDRVRAAEDIAAAYRSAVPAASYDKVEPWIDRVRSGARGVLTADDVSRLMPSSGSTSAAKLLPYTPSLQRELSAAIDPWTADVQLRYPGVLGGSAYWSISPAIPHDTSGPIPVGFDDDTEYLGAAKRMLSSSVLAVPDAIAKVEDPESFRYLTLLFLVARRDLRLISVWHPSFLERLLDVLPGWMPAIAADIAAGTLTPPRQLPDLIRQRLLARAPRDAGRAAELAALQSFDLRVVWPRLTVVSCWDDGYAKPAADALRRVLPDIRLQPKGLVATEGIVSIPFGGRHPLAVNSHFVEFLDDDGGNRLADELSTGSEYGVVLTTSGGLYRYRLGDRVVVDGWVDGTPSLRFAGREDRVSDRFGEKVSEGFVITVLRRLFGGSTLPRFAMLAPEEWHDGTAYTLFVTGGVARDLPRRLESELRRNPHYAWCVGLRQLLPARVVALGTRAEDIYVDTCAARGQRNGDIKPAALHTQSGWRRAFRDCIETADAC
jgi:hypothetical protein